jgi:hypothetical protein
LSTRSVGVIEGRMDTSLNVAYGPAITAAATSHHLDPRLLAAVAAQETGGPGTDSGRNIVGDEGHGHGLFQIDDRWHTFARTPEAMDPAKNADYAAGMISANLSRYGGNVHKALSAYNTGSPTATGTKTDWGDGKPLGYADSVLRHYAQLGGSTAATPAGQTDARDAAESVDALRGAAAQLSANGQTPAVGSAAMLNPLSAIDPLPATSTLSSAGQTGQTATTGQSSSTNTADEYPPEMMPLNLPAYKPLAQIDSTERDVAPSVAGFDDSSDD